MYSDKTINAWVKEGELRNYRERFIAEIGICLNQQKDVKNFTTKEAVKIAKKNYKQFQTEKK